MISVYRRVGERWYALRYDWSVGKPVGSMIGAVDLRTKWTLLEVSYSTRWRLSAVLVGDNGEIMVRDSDADAADPEQAWLLANAENPTDQTLAPNGR
jgi:hypothetical protein